MQNITFTVNQIDEAKTLIGATIRGHDLKFIEGCSRNAWVDGVVKSVELVRGEYYAYVIECTFDTYKDHSRVGETVYVPVQTGNDHEGRVQLVSEAA